MVYDGARGGALVSMMSAIGYDVWCPGNHELDISQENLRRLASVASFPMVCANLVDSAGHHPLGNRPFVLLTAGGIRVGVIGLMSQSLAGLVLQENLVGLYVSSPAATLQQWIDSLDAGTDLLVALTHQGAAEDSELAASVHGLDIIVGGHSHTRLRSPKIVNGVRVVQAGTAAEYLGILTLEVRDDSVVHSEGELLPLWVGDPPGRSRLTRTVDSIAAIVDSAFSEVIATLAVDWIRSDSGGPMGYFITEAQRVAAGAEVAFMNVHGIRKDKRAGPLTRKDLFEILPFHNLLATFRLSGDDLRRILLHHIALESKILISGLEVEWRRRTDGSVELLRVEVDGEPLERNRSYVCAASDFLAGHAQEYLGLTVDRPLYLRTTMREAVSAAAREARIIRASGRQPVRMVR
jgi:2',3'-cyclic-nucleotide 2'-phosphodiesterase (5'-nucleotidase family)